MKTFFQRLKASGAAFLNSWGSFDGAMHSPQRSSTMIFPYDSRQEIRPWDRRELVKKHRSLRNNLGCIRGIINTTVDLSIGWGLQPIPKSGNKEFNQRALAYWKRQTKRRSWDVKGKNNQAMMQRLLLREAITDGEIFVNKLVDQFGRLQRQVLKTEVISDAPRSAPDEAWEDGIQYNSLGRALRYRVRRKGPGGQERYGLVDARDMMHVYEEERATQQRGLPWGYTGLNHGVDVLDITAFEKIAHKLNSAIIAGMTTPTGKAAEGMNALMNAAKAAQAAGTAAAAPATRKDTGAATRFLDLHGSMVPLFKIGEELEFYPRRNSITTMEFAGWLLAQYAQGFGLPVEFVVGMTQGSAAVRGNTDLAGRFFERVQMMMIADVCQPDWDNVISTGILAYAYPMDYPGVEPLEPPPGWTGWDVVEWRGPRNITVDRGREGKLYLELLRAGKMTDEEWWTLNGEDPQEMAATVDDEVVEARERWLERGLPEEYFWRRMFPNNMPADAAAPAEPDSGQDPGQGGGK